MKATTDFQSAEATLEQAETLCRKRGARFTPMRREVFELMLELNRAERTSLVLVTHDRRLAHRLDRVMELQQGRLHALP